jgi:putative Holliday junction resolvase
MKYIGIDYGTKNIGVAVSDDSGSVAFPHSVVPAGRDALSKIVALIKENGAGEVVMGESRNFAGEKNEVMEDIEQFKKDLGELAGVPVHYEREFFTSAMAARQFAPEEKSPSGVGRPRASRKANPSQDKLDASAAALILQSYLDRKRAVQ